MTMDILSLIEAVGGEIVGKVRLQKMVYLLDQLGVNTGYSFDYYHYGPYSDELADSVEEAVVFGRVEAEQRRRRADGVPFVVYKKRTEPGDEKSGTELNQPKIRSALEAMQRRSALVLEIAATIHWLANAESLNNWRDELIRRKGVKTESGRIEAALDLLRELQLAPA